MADALAFFQQMQFELSRITLPGSRVFEVRRNWKAMYSSLNSSFNALANIICVVVGQKSPFGKDPAKPWNYTPKDALNLTQGRGLKQLAEAISRCIKRMEIRDHLDHYWVIWHAINQGQFLLDDKFQKGYVPIHPESEVSPRIDALKRAADDINGLAQDFNSIYQELATDRGFLDKYLAAKGWRIDYSDYGSPHNGKRPQP